MLIMVALFGDENRTSDNSRYQKFINFEHLNGRRSSESWVEVYTLTNMDQARENLINILSENINKCRKTIKVKRSGIKRNIWIIDGLMKSIETKDTLY